MTTAVVMAVASFAPMLVRGSRDLRRGAGLAPDPVQPVAEEAVGVARA